jgi:hypothetical protein
MCTILSSRFDPDCVIHSAKHTQWIAVWKFRQTVIISTIRLCAYICLWRF